MANQTEAWMRRALDLAECGRRTVSPNPLVGCVLVREGEVVGEGWHARPGGAHAEVVALQAAGDRAAGACAYVSLEPCNHTARTGPCTQALIAAGVAKVVYALADPDPLAAGGARALAAAGIAVEQGPLEEAAAWQNEVFLHGVAHRRPFVIAKAAVSLDGRIAAADGTSQWLTGEGARQRAHELRAAVDAVVVGSGTVLADDPQLTVRVPGYDGPQPLRVVLDAGGRTTQGHRVADGSSPTLLLTDYAARIDSKWERKLRCRGVEVVDGPSSPAAANGGGIDEDFALWQLWDRQVRSVLVEGGATVLSSFLRERLVDKLIVHVAPLLLGEAGRAVVNGDWPTTLGEVGRWRMDRAEQVGDDVVLVLYPREPARGPDYWFTREES